MKIRFLIDDGAYTAGDVIEPTNELAQRLIARRIAERVDDREPNMMTPAALRCRAIEDEINGVRRSKVVEPAPAATPKATPAKAKG